MHIADMNKNEKNFLFDFIYSVNVEKRRLLSIYVIEHIINSETGER